MAGILLITGIVLVLFGAGAGLWLPSAPSSIQTNTLLKPIGSYLINNGGKVVLAGLALIVLALFVFRGRG